MTEVVTAIRRVTDIMGEISASSEQSAGVGQVGEAVTQMDQATQQNAALVEEMAAAAASLNTQADELVPVAVFQLDANATAARAPVPVRPSCRSPQAALSRARSGVKNPLLRLGQRLPAAKASTAPATPKANDDDWESF